jgi:hypothetical protein
MNEKLTKEILEDIFYKNPDVNGFGKKIKFNITDPSYGTRTFRFTGLTIDGLKKIILEPMIEGINTVITKRDVKDDLKTQTLSILGDFLHTDVWKNHIAIDIK